MFETKIMIRKYLYIFSTAALLAACNGKLQTTEEGVSYRLIETNESERTVAKGDMLQIHMIGKIESNDSAIYNSYANNKPFYIPADEPTLKSLFALLHKNDSAFFKISADTLYNKSFGSGRPPFIKEADFIVFNMRLVNIYNQQELQSEINKQNQTYIDKDSVAMNDFIAKIPDIKKTASGIYYKTLKAGSGKKPVKGQKVQVKYKGTLLDGTVFDESKEGQPDFTFNLGLGQVIPGWDEMVSLMQEGEEVQAIIPWKLAYGERGMGPIPQYSTLVFNIQLIKVN